MTKNSFASALIMLGFKPERTGDNNLYRLGIGTSLSIKPLFFIKVIFRKYKNDTPLIEINGSKVHYNAYMSYTKAYKFIVEQELN